MSDSQGETKAEELRVAVHNPRLRDLLGREPVLETLGESFAFTEGPVWHPVKNHLLFTDIPHSQIFCWAPECGYSLYRDNTNKANGLAYDRAGRLLVCEHATSRVVRLNDTGKIEILASKFEGKELNSPNDIISTRSGDIYFTDPLYGRMADPWGVKRPAELGFRGVFRLEPTTRRLSVVADDFDGPNGLCLSRDERRLYINDSERQHIRVFDLTYDGTISGGEVWAETQGPEEGCPDGMKIDVAGNIYCCGPGGIHVFSESAECLGIIFLPPVVTNFTFGGRDMRDLFITASNRLHRVRTAIPGIPAF